MHINFEGKMSRHYLISKGLPSMYKPYKIGLDDFCFAIFLLYLAYYTFLLGGGGGGGGPGKV